MQPPAHANRPAAPARVCPLPILVIFDLAWHEVRSVPLLQPDEDDVDPAWRLDHAYRHIHEECCPICRPRSRSDTT